MKRSFSKIPMFLASLLVAAIGVTACGTSAPATTTSTMPPTATATSTTTPPATPATSQTPAMSTTPAQAVTLNGAGATFPAPLYSRWFDVYFTQNNVKINYQAVGSGAGITQVTEGTVDFGASDGIMTTDQQTKAEATRGPILHIPMTAGAVAVVYNVTGLSGTQIKLTGDVLADIYLKKISNWNDARIVALNSGVTLPNSQIAVVHRSDGSGTTNIFTNYLAKVSDEWKTKIGSGNSVNWPGDVGGQGNAGVAGQVQQIPGAIGYVELSYALQNNITFAILKNAAGNFIAPSLASTSKAAEGVAMPDDMKIMLTNSTNPDAYPIVGFTWLLVYKNQTDKAKGQTIVNMLWWAVHQGQEYCEPLSYGRLAKDAITKAENQILSINYQGQPLRTR